MSKSVISASAKYFGLIARQMNVKLHSVSLVKRSGVIPGGFPYNAFSGGAKVKPEAMMQAVETVRANIFTPSSDCPEPFLHAHKIYKDYFMFISASTMQVKEEIYDPNISKGPLLFDVELEYIGNTSSQLKTSFFIHGMSEPVITSRVSTVFVCSKTRLPKPAPDWWLEKYKNGLQVGGKSIGKLSFTGGDDSQSTECQFQVSPSECDPYRHTNWSNYMRYCQDAFAHHRHSRLGDGGYDDYFLRGVKSFSILYKNESSIGDVLTVKISPEKVQEGMNSDAHSTFYFSVENDVNKMVCQSKIEYYPRNA